METEGAERFDVVVVGGGSAGCVMASRLSEDGHRRVLLLEAGVAYAPGDYPGALTDINGYTVQPSFIWDYSSAIGRPVHNIAAFAGRLLGGTSAINGAISRRARPSDLARWQRHGLDDWSWPNALTTYKALENTSIGSDEWHGREGPWPIRQPELAKISPVSQAFVKAAMNAGFDWIDDLNGPKQHGVGLEPRNMEDGFRFNTGMAYLGEEVRARGNLVIRGNCSVDRILFENSKVVGVALAGGEEIATDEIVLSAGVYGTPGILLRSGIGPRAHLQDLGIELVADSPVGLRLQEQPMFVLSYTLKPEAKTDPPNGSVAVWTNSKGETGNELDLQLTAFSQPDVDQGGVPIRTLRIWASVVLPRSTGQLRLGSPDPAVSPTIEYGLLSSPADRERQREMIRLARRIAAMEPLASLIDRELSPGSDAQADEQLDEAIDATGGIYYHATSTAPMGIDPASSVADGQGRVHGVAGLRVADASAFPEMVSPPVNLTVLMLAERIAEGMRR